MATKKTQANPPIDLKKAVEDEREARAKACAAELAEVLKRHRCQLSPIVVVAGGQLQRSEVVIVAEPL